MPQKTQKKENLPVKVDVDLQNGGTISYANEVIATIAGVAANEIDGIAGMCVSGGFSEILGRNKNITRGVKVEVGSQEAAVDLYVIVEYGKPIQKLAAEVQENVRKALESLTGLHVVRVDVHVQGVSFEKEKRANQNSLEASKNPVLTAPSEEPATQEEVPAAEGTASEPDPAQEPAPAEDTAEDEIVSDDVLSEDGNAFDGETLAEEAQVDGAEPEEAAETEHIESVLEESAPAEDAAAETNEPAPKKRGRKKAPAGDGSELPPRPRGRKRA